MKIIGIAIMAICLTSCAMFESKGNYRPPQGYVPDAKTAESIAEAVWIPIYGKDQINGERPFESTLSFGVWTVKGTLPKNCCGGVAEIEIRKSDGMILRVIHYK
ncbi:MAG: NTF2 fold immunity protein [bacterium]